MCISICLQIIPGNLQITSKHLFMLLRLDFELDIVFLVTKLVNDEINSLLFDSEVY